MPENDSPLVAIVGYKRRKLAPLGRVRLLVVRDSKLRLLDKDGKVELESPLDDLTVRLTRTRTAELRAPAGSALLFGVNEETKLDPGLVELAAGESEGAELLGPTPTGALGVLSPKAASGPAKVSRASVEALQERGARAG